MIWVNKSIKGLDVRNYWVAGVPSFLDSHLCQCTSKDSIRGSSFMCTLNSRWQAPSGRMLAGVWTKVTSLSLRSLRLAWQGWPWPLKLWMQARCHLLRTLQPTRSLLMERLATAFTAEGIATWTIGYRGQSIVMLGSVYRSQGDSTHDYWYLSVYYFIGSKW